MAGALELFLDPNGDEIKLRWSRDDDPPSKPLRLSIDQLRKRSRDVREALTALNRYVCSNQNFEEDKDPGWRNYGRALKALQQRGRALRSTLLNEEDPRGRELLSVIENLPAGTELRVSCSDDEVTLPLGFVFEGEIGARGERPSRADFVGFWLDRFKITMLVEGSGAGQERRSVDPQSLKALYALHRTEVEHSLPYLGEDLVKLQQITSLPVRQYYDWDTAIRAYNSIRDFREYHFHFCPFRWQFTRTG